MIISACHLYVQAVTYVVGFISCVNLLQSDGSDGHLARFQGLFCDQPHVTLSCHIQTFRFPENDGRICSTAKLNAVISHQLLLYNIPRIEHRIENYFA